MEQTVHTKAFLKLGVTELYTIMQLRIAVFVVEQQCPYQEVDDIDPRAMHLWLSDEKGATVAYARIYDDGKFARIGRVLVAPAFRKQKLGEQVVAEAIAWIMQYSVRDQIKIEAQAHLQSFYQKFGFVTTSEEYLEDGIPHVDMVMEIPR